MTVDSATLQVSGGLYVGSFGDGTLEVRNGAQVYGSSFVLVPNAPDAFGTLLIEDGWFSTQAMEIDVQGDVTQSGGTLSVDFLNHSFGGTFSFVGGTLIADEFIGDLVQDGGTFSPWGDTNNGESLINGAYQLNAGGTLAIDLYGSCCSPGPLPDFDHVSATDVTLAGTLAILVDPSYTPVLDDAFEIITASNAITGTFDTVTGADLGDDLKLEVQYNGAPDVTSVSLVVVEAVIAGDCDADGDVDLMDYSDFNACLLGPGNGIGVDCDCFDLDDDGDVTVRDFMTLQSRFTGR